MRVIKKEERVHILQTLADCKGDYVQAAKKLSISVDTISWVDMVENKRFNYTEAGRGRPELWKYIVAIRSVFETLGWRNNDKAIIKAREDYDAGKVELCTGRDGENLILYAIPRKVIAKGRKPYFNDLS